MNIPGLPPVKKKTPKSVVFRKKGPTPAFREVKAQDRRKANVGKFFRKDPKDPLATRDPFTPPKTKKPPTRAATAPKAPAPSRTAAAPRATPSVAPRATPPPASGGSVSRPTTAGGASPRGGGTPQRSAPTTAPASPEPTSATTTTDTSTSSVNDLYAPARRALERQRASLDATKAAEMGDWDAYNKWLETKQTAAETNLADQQTAVRALAQQRQAATEARIMGFTDNARRLVGGNIPADMAQQSGLDAVAASQGYQEAGNAASAAQLDNQQNVNNRSLVDAREVNKARAANMLGSINQTYAGGVSKLRDAGLDLEQKQADATLADTYKRQQLTIDQQAADFLQGIKSGELDVKKSNAATARTKVQLDAKAKAATLRITEAYNNGRLDIAKETARLKKLGYNLAKRKQIFAEAKANRNGGGSPADAQKVRKEANTFLDGYLKQYAPTGAPRGDEGIAFATRLISALAGHSPTLKVERVAEILGARLPADVYQDERVQRAIYNSQAFH